MMRKTLFNEGGLFYDPSYRRSQDYDLWVRASKHTRFSNINKTLMLYRINAGSAAKDNGDEKAFYAMRVARGLIEQLGITPSDDELVLHSSLSNMKFKPEKRYITQSGDWLNRLVEANKKSSVYPVPAFSRVLARRWFDVCASSGLGYWAVREYLGSPLARTTLPGIRQVLRYVSGYARSWS